MPGLPCRDGRNRQHHPEHRTLDAMEGVNRENFNAHCSSKTTRMGSSREHLYGLQSYVLHQPSKRSDGSRCLAGSFHPELSSPSLF